jgi:hypothetical protein
MTDNSLAETINGLDKTELIKKQGPWRGVDHVGIATAEWGPCSDERPGEPGPSPATSDRSGEDRARVAPSAGELIALSTSLAPGRSTYRL